MFKNASVAPFVVRRFVRSFIRRSFVRSFFRSLARFFVFLLDGRYVSPLVLRSFACSLFIIDPSLFTVRRLPFVFCRSFIRSSINRKVSCSCLRSVGRSFSLSIDWSVRRNHKTHFDTSKDVMTAGAELSSLANAVCIVSLCLSTRRLLHTLNGTKQKKKPFSNLFESESNS